MKDILDDDPVIEEPDITVAGIELIFALCGKLHRTAHRYESMPAGQPFLSFEMVRTNEMVVFSRCKDTNADLREFLRTRNEAFLKEEASKNGAH